jgi:hypothetical protein
MAKYFLFGAFCILVLTATAAADFNAIRTIPAPYGTWRLKGLDYAYDQGALFAVSSRSDCADLCSHIYLFDSDVGGVWADQDFIEPPPDCPQEPSRLVSCAYVGENTYWVGDLCGDVIEFHWSNGLINVVDSFLVGYQCPVHLVADGMVAGGDTLYMLSGYYGQIRVYYPPTHETVDIVSLPTCITDATSITFFHGNYLVSSAVADSVYEISPGGDLIATHWLQGLGDRNPTGITFFGDELYVASNSDSIVVFGPAAFEREVPEGDSIAVEVVPDGLEVVFDSVSTAGTITGNVNGTDPCPPPSGVSFFDVFYDVSSSAAFDYAAQVILSTDEPLPGGVQAKLVRVFVRPSGECEPYKDMTTEPTQVEPGDLLASITRTISEDYEFSVFALGEDHRAPGQVVDLKFDDLEGTIDAQQEQIPPAALVRINDLVDRAREAYCRGLSAEAAVLVDSIAAIVRTIPEIPHTYHRFSPTMNVSGRLISEAHTLSFSLRFSAEEAMATAGVMVPKNISVAGDGWARAYLEIPGGISAAHIDANCVFFEHEAQAVPDSFAVADFDSDGQPEIKAVFHSRDVAAALEFIGPGVGTVSCFGDGFEIYADVAVSKLGVADGLMADGPYLAGSIVPVNLNDLGCRLGSASIWFSADAGQTWAPVASGIRAASYNLVVPSVITDRALLKVSCVMGAVERSVVSRDFSIQSPAGVGIGGEGRVGLVVRPNPSTSSFAIEFSPEGRGPVEVCVYSVKGEMVRVLRAAAPAGGPLEVVWRGDNQNGARVSPGTYFVIAREGENTSIRKVILQR